MQTRETLNQWTRSFVWGSLAGQPSRQESPLSGAFECLLAGSHCRTSNGLRGSLFFLQRQPRSTSGQSEVPEPSYQWELSHDKKSRKPSISQASSLLYAMTAILADAGLITDMRTAGSSAVAVDALASPGEITLGLVGARTQAYWHAAAIAAVRCVANVRVWARDVDKAEATARRIRHDLSLPCDSRTSMTRRLRKSWSPRRPHRSPSCPRKFSVRKAWWSLWEPTP